MKYDIIIIGCGISALFYLYHLQKINSNLKIAILEKKPWIGGRIHSSNINGSIIDSGALRFTKDHKDLIALLKELDINNYKKLTSKKNIKLNAGLKKKLKEFISKTSHKKYANYPLSSIAKIHFTNDEYSLIKLWYGYDEEWENIQCYYWSDAIKNYTAEEYYYFPDGFSILPQTLYEKIKNNPNYSFHFTTKVMKIANTNNIYTSNNQHFTANNIIFACPPHYISKINGTTALQPILSAIGSITLNRMYAKFPKQKWFPKNAIHSESPICQIVPIDEEVIMVSYTTGKDAEFWIAEEQNGTLWKTMKKLLESHFNQKIEKPEWIKQNYWNPATHYYNTGFNPKNTENNSFKPLANENWHIIGEAFSMNQGWVDGALNNTKKFIKKCDKNGLPNFTIEEKEFSMKEVEKHNKKDDAWIVLWENVYDISKWIKIHPGGDVIMYGVGKDVTAMFENVGHSKDALEFLEKYKIGGLKNN